MPPIVRDFFQENLLNQQVQKTPDIQLSILIDFTRIFLNSLLHNELTKWINHWIQIFRYGSYPGQTIIPSPTCHVRDGSGRDLNQ